MSYKLILSELRRLRNVERDKKVNTNVQGYEGLERAVLVFVQVLTAICMEKLKKTRLNLMIVCSPADVRIGLLDILVLFPLISFHAIRYRTSDTGALSYSESHRFDFLPGNNLSRSTFHNFPLFL
jgi:hypothetical protein